MDQQRKQVASVKIDRDLCIGAAACVAVMPEAFELDSENKALLVPKRGKKTSNMTNVSDLPEQDQEKIWMSAEVCPVRAVLLYDEEGKQIYP